MGVRVRRPRLRQWRLMGKSTGRLIARQDESKRRTHAVCLWNTALYHQLQHHEDSSVGNLFLNWWIDRAMLVTNPRLRLFVNNYCQFYLNIAILKIVIISKGCFLDRCTCQVKIKFNDVMRYCSRRLIVDWCLKFLCSPSPSPLPIVHKIVNPPRPEPNNTFKWRLRPSFHNVDSNKISSSIGRP